MRLVFVILDILRKKQIFSPFSKLRVVRNFDADRQNYQQESFLATYGNIWFCNSYSHR